MYGHNSSPLLPLLQAGERWEAVKPAILMSMEDEYQDLFGEPLTEAELARLIVLIPEDSDDEMEALLS